MVSVSSISSLLSENTTSSFALIFFIDLSSEYEFASFSVGFGSLDFCIFFTFFAAIFLLSKLFSFS